MSAVPALAQSGMESQRLKNADILIYSGRCADALAQLRPLYDASPLNDKIALSLKNAYVCLKDYDSARVVLERLIARTGDPSQQMNYQLEMAGLLFRMGEKERGEKLIRETAALEPFNLQFGEQAADVYLMHGYYADAVKFLVEQRQQIGAPGAFARKLAQVYEILRNYGDAAREYFAVVQRDTAQEIAIAGKISSLIKLDAQEEFDTGLGKALGEIVAANPRSKEAQRFYGDYLVAQGDMTGAFERFRMVDSLAAGKGRFLLYFARAARENGVKEMVHEACAAIQAIGDSPYLVQSQFLLAESHIDEGQYREAAAIFDTIIVSTPNERDRSDALYSLGAVQLNGIHDPRTAIATLERLNERYPRSPLAAAGRVLIADSYLALGQALVADSLYAQIDINTLPQRHQEELLFKRAELQFYTGNFEAAREAYSKMMNAHPKSVFVNDCLRRILLITEYAGMDEATLQIFAAALFEEFRFEYDAALASLAKLRYRESKILPELAWMNSAAILQSLGQTQAALAAYDSLVQLHPESFYTPLAIERKGDIYSDVLNDCEQARTSYRQVVLNYPGSLNLEEVRKKLQHTEKFLCTRTEKPKS